MSSENKDPVEKRERCPNGERWNTRTKKCEAKKPKKYTFKRGQGQGQVILQKKDLQKDAQTIPEALAALSQELIAVHPANPEGKGKGEGKESKNELTAIHPARVKESNILDTIKEATQPLQQHPIQIVKSKKRIKLVKPEQPVEDSLDYNSMNGQALRDIWATLMGLPLGQKTSGKFTKKADLIQEIIRLKAERSSIKPLVLGNTIRDNTVIIPEEPFVSEAQSEAKGEIEGEIEGETAGKEENPIDYVLNHPEKEKEPEVNPEEEPFHKELESEAKSESEEFEEEPVNEEDIFRNNELAEMEMKEYMAAKDDKTYEFLYPALNDPNFNIKIAKRKEFNDTKYDGTIYDIKKQADLLCNADFELMPHQLFVKNFLSFQTPYNSLLLYNSLGTGKCHSKDTPIIMYDGSIKMVQDIMVGDLLMGDNSTPRKVISLATGKDKMYDVIPVKGEKYTVNSEHILCLRASGFPKICYNNRAVAKNYNIQWLENNEFKTKNYSFNQVKNNEEKMKVAAQEFYEKILENPATNNNVLEISINDYLNLPKSKKAILKGYKVPIEFEEKELPIDPYMIGYWLGDGGSRDPIITSQDSTVLHYFANNLPNYHLGLHYRSEYSYGISGNGKNSNNQFLNALKDLKMLNNKHIPMLYKCNSRENRLKLLAGLIDSDGNLSENGGFEFSQKNEKLMDDVIYLARSLGFSCYKAIKKTSWTYKDVKNEGSAFRININGNGIEEIPTLIPRKKALPRKQIKDVLVTGIKVEYVKEDDYYGFTLDGNCRYVMGDFTVTHNTCSAIGIAEEMRSYMKQIGLAKKILVIASPNVQANFRMQLFDEHKLKEDNGIWNLNTCVGNSLLKEVNPTSLKGIPREKVVSQIKSIVNGYYLFMGYTEFANYITKKTMIAEDSGFSEHEKRSYEVKKIRKVFNNSLIVIDEVHNMRITDDNKNKRTAMLLMKVAKHANNLRLLLLSATPMYNTYKEIIWLLNLMNINDKRATVTEDQIFDKEGNFINAVTEAGKEKEGGRELLQRKLIGYVSYVRGENPYTFPFRIYPDLFSPENLIKPENYPKSQMNKKPIESPIQHVPVFVSKIGEYQNKGYSFIMENMRKRSFNKSNSYGDETVMPTFENMERFGYTLLEVPLESLNIVYPSLQFDDFLSRKEVPYNQEEYSEIIANIIGKRGLSNIMTYDTIKSPQPMRLNFDYKPEVLTKYGKIFAKENIGKYSNKIGKFCEQVLHSKGILIIYSQYIDGGCVPIALALEELGFARYGSEPYTKSLLKNPVEPIDALTMKPKSQVTGDFKQAKYVMITGDPFFSPNNANDIKYITKPENKNGELVKVIIISKAASEGLDFKNIRQVHIMEPWYNMNRIEQIIGRGVRNLSHCGLPFEDRNVELYLHATLPQNDEEPADLYVYRLAEKKALQIGKVTRVLKESAVDCLLNIGQTNFTVDKMMALAENANIKINLSSKPEPVDFKIGDKDFTDVCDYMECQKDFKCLPHAEPVNDKDTIKDTYSEEYVKMNYPMILKRIRQLYREQSFYKKDQLFAAINLVKKYPEEQIYYCLSELIDNKNEYLIDRYGRRGYLINRGEYYAFQPIEITDENASIFERDVPVDYKRDSMLLELEKNVVLPDSVKPVEKSIAPLGDEEEKGDKKEGEEIKRTYETIMSELQKSLDTALNSKSIQTGDTDWFIHISQVLDILKDVHKIPLVFITKYIIYHYLDTLDIGDRLTIIGRLYAIDFDVDGEKMVETIMRGYFDDKKITNRMSQAIILADKKVLKMFILKEGKWVEARQVDREKFTEKQNEKFLLDKENINNFVGFMSTFKGQKIMFKTKDLSQARNNIGAVCSQSGKADIIKRLNSVLEENIYSIKTTDAILKFGMCALLELILRYFTEINYKGRNKTYFMDTERALLNKVSDL